MRDENALDREVEQRPQLAREVGLSSRSRATMRDRARRRPRRPRSTSPGTTAAACSEPVDGLRPARGLDRADPGRKHVRRLPSHRAAVALGELGGASLVPMAGEEDDDRAAEPVDVAVERLEEPCSVRVAPAARGGRRARQRPRLPSRRSRRPAPTRRRWSSTRDEPSSSATGRRRAASPPYRRT